MGRRHQTPGAPVTPLTRWDELLQRRLALKNNLRRSLLELLGIA